ncbi:hypothetical protein LTR66_014390 [Elasticomyces elasticus]|nr:hypothetical protein LTR66_014390 [Elasticomyces elasticus]KAK4987236.1 hypothetical protein LTR50_004748 [Elasticomyces elasticus]KAK5004327.1 hypothetical protein LTR28_009059 [Elasticomyces elasticus]
MSSKLIPSNPEEVMVIRKITPALTTLSVPFLRFGRIKIGGRGTIVRLQNGSLAVFSPVALTDSVHQTLRELGEVKYITALDQEHHIFVESWHKAFPEARVIGPDTLPKKNPSRFSVLFPAKGKENVKVDEAFDREFDYEYVDAHPNLELVFCHKPSKTLIEADLLFNLPATEQMSKTGESATSGLLTGFFCSLNNTNGSAIWQKRFIWYLLSARNRTGFNQSMARIDKFDFDRIVPCHGDVIETGGKGIFRTVMEWHLAAARKDQ